MAADSPGEERRDEETLIVFRGAHNFVVLNRFPYTSGHLMIVPYRHVADLAGLTDAAANELMTLTRAAERLKLTRHSLRYRMQRLGMKIGDNTTNEAPAAADRQIPET